MQILAAENCPGDLVDALQSAGHDVAWVRADARGNKDSAILARAQVESRLILTFEKDFGEFAFRARLPAASGIILCRLHGLPPPRVVAIVLAALNSRPDLAGRFTVITEQQIRVIALPST
jgi:predicted nuclease of predicted toxin-antitoxin system